MADRRTSCKASEVFKLEKCQYNNAEVYAKGSEVSANHTLVFVAFEGSTSSLHLPPSLGDLLPLFRCSSMSNEPDLPNLHVRPRCQPSLSAQMDC